MLNNSSFFKIVLVLLILVRSVDYTAQEVYKFTPPTTPYATSYKNIDKNAYNKKVLDFIAASHPIYLDNSTISFDENHIKTQLNSFDTTYPLTINYYTRNYIKTYAQENKIAYGSRLYNYFSVEIEQSIANNNLPKAFRFIPLVASGFNPLSNNTKGGIGFWQLNYLPAIKYGLTVNKYIDERKDFEKSTKAATQYLKDIYPIYNDWELTLAAYSCGIVTVNKALLRTNGTTFWDIYPYLPSETRDIVPALTAMVYCFNEAGNNHFLLSQSPTINDTVYINRKLQFKAIEKVINVKSKDLTFLNPIVNGIVFPENYMAIFPKETCEKFTEFEDSIYYYQDSILLKPKPTTPAVVIPKDGEPFIYTVRSGDVLGVIASRYNVRVSQIQDWNNINGTRINVGQKLTIYGPKKTKTKPSVIKSQKTDAKISNSQPTKPEKQTTENKPQAGNNNSSKTKEYTNYTVKSGDSLWIIAKKYSGVSSQNIMDFNAIGENLTVGQVLKIPKN